MPYRGGLWQGAAILMLAGLFNRALSFVYRVLVIRLIGPESMGLYEMVFPVYTLVLVVATAGIPVALAKLAAEQVARQEWSRARSVFRLSLFCLSISGLASTLLLYGAAPYLAARVFPDSRVYPAFLAMLPALPLVCICSAFRGYFQGLQLMRALAVSQVMEQVVRVSSGLWLAMLFLPRGIERAAAGLAWGMVLGEGVGLLTSLFIFRRARGYYELDTGPAPLWRDFLPLARMALPVTVARAAGSLVLALEALLIPRQLQAWGVAAREATTLYGQYSGIALTLVYLPMIITVAVALVMVPAMAEAQALKNYGLLQKRCHQALRLTVVSGLPFAVFFYLLAGEISGAIFRTPAAGEPLKVLAWGCLFLYLQQTTNGILNGLGAMKIALYTTLADGVVDLLAVYFLTPLWGIAGAALGVNLGCALGAFLNLLAIRRLTRVRLDTGSLFWRPCSAALLLGLGVRPVWELFSGWPEPWQLAGTLAGGSLLYLAALFLTRAVPGRYLPRGKWA